MKCSMCGNMYPDSWDGTIEMAHHKIDKHGMDLE